MEDNTAHQRPAEVAEDTGDTGKASVGEKRKRSTPDNNGEDHNDHETGRGGRGGGGKRDRQDRGGWQKGGNRNGGKGGKGGKGGPRSSKTASLGGMRSRVERTRRKDQDGDGSNVAYYATEFSKEEIQADERRPKRKVAVMIGYAGTGYYGMQLNDQQKTIEGDLFKAFVNAGAISKANADDPKKVSLVRCARTDKGVHAAGNVISLKLVVEDEDIVQKINEHLVPQIRVWGIERTMNNFSAYANVDSRIYEYLIPTHCFLPPHPKTHLGKKLAELAEEVGDTDGWKARQRDVISFWDEAEETYVKPVLEEIDPQLREAAWDLVFDQESLRSIESKAGRSTASKEPSSTRTLENGGAPEKASKGPRVFSDIEAATIKLKGAVRHAKKSWRITPERMALIKSALSKYEGVKNFHNYTTPMSPKDPSAKRVIKSFVVNETPILINDTEWLSMKVHGQSFMMHQIRKMVGMAALVVRCGTHESRFQDSMNPERMSIPRAPGLGLLLERPIFDAYNNKLKSQQGAPDRKDVSFDGYQKEIDEFKQREIYDRIYREEHEHSQFHQIFWSVDNLKTSQFLYLTSKGLAAVEKGGRRDNASRDIDADSSGDEDSVGATVPDEGN